MVEEANSLINLHNSSHHAKPHISTILINNINIIIIFVYHYYHNNCYNIIIISNLWLSIFWEHWKKIEGSNIPAICWRGGKTKGDGGDK